MTGAARARADRLLGDAGLFVSGEVDDGGRTILLLSPDEPGFWSLFEVSAEASDGAPDPLDRWSRRVIGGIATALGTPALFPFEGPPWHPFPTWAIRSGRAWTAPMGLVVHETAGLWISYRGAVVLDGVRPETHAARAPCEPCAKPCLTACPVDAFAGGTYDVPRCKAHLAAPEGCDCRDLGCRVRRACPVGRDRRLPAQSAFHMEAFAPT